MPDIDVVLDPVEVLIVETPGSTIQVFELQADSTLVEVLTETPVVLSYETVIEVLALPAILVSGGSGTGNSYFPSGW